MASDNSLNRARDEFGKYIKVTATTPPLIQKASINTQYPDLIDVRVSNPVTYLKLWFAQFFKNSEITFTVKIRPMALISLAIAISIILGGTGFSVFYFIQEMLNRY